MEKLSKVIISPPFGTYIRVKNASSVFGTFTNTKRKGLIIQVIKTLRKTSNGWVNKIGLRNKGILKVNKRHKVNDIISIAAIDEQDFELMLPKLLKLQSEKILKTNIIEINLSCPNADTLNISKDILKQYLKYFEIIIKLPPKVDIKKFEELVSWGVKIFHISNTLPSEKGGISGKILKPLNLKTIQLLKQQYGSEITIIAGGGIYSKNDVIDYKNAGADLFSIATICFNPIKALQLIKYINNNY